MKRVFTAIAFCMLAWVFVTLLCVFINTVGVWLYGWENNGEGYFIGSVILGPIAGVTSGAFTYLEFEPK